MCLYCTKRIARACCVSYGINQENLRNHEFAAVGFLQGHGFIQGTGSWSRNNHGSKSWPSAGQTFVLSATS